MHSRPLGGRHAPFGRAIRRLTTDNGRDPLDGSELNAVRRDALALLERDDDDLTDQEIFAQEANDAYWFTALALETLGRLPSELDAILTCREYTMLQAYHIVKKAMASLARQFG